MDTALDQAIEVAGGIRSLARKLGIDHSNICQWRKRGAVPASQAIQIEFLTDGKIRAVDFFEHTSLSATSTVAQAASSESVEIITPGE